MRNRGFMDRITNRDVVEKQAEAIRTRNDVIGEQREVIAVQSSAIDEFRVSVTELVDEITKLRDNDDPDKLKRVQKELDDLKLANAQFKLRAETEVKRRLIYDIRRVSSHSIEYLSERSINELEQILEDARNEEELKTDE